MELLKSTESYLLGNIDRHVANLENLLDNHMALAEHPDIVETIEKELQVIANYDEKLNVLQKYFKSSRGTKKVLNG